ncbi:bacillithiol biosynthesis deacetylase BshB2 [Shouchella patagoniensis]|uniref:bacillithiol biosynthesis deacetylase BshB2 n=1 Tax=Shouchella patagoniensis TaxID=228576 RepID=UPI0009957139|nr:bacillithiol biosynthesis deacetylase BshB2 [Shouchella patagoniensis]
MKKERHVLVIFPHPDDEAFGVSGTIASHIDVGTPVTYACLTLGEMGRNLGNPPFATRESLPEIRKSELKNAASVMGITDLRMLGFRDKTIEFETPGRLKNIVLNLISELNPSLVISFYPGYAVHPDHDATGEAVVDALAELPKEQRPVFHAVAFSNNHEEEIGKADVVHDVSNYALLKLDTLRAHASQLAWTLPGLEKAYHDGVQEAVDRLTQERFWTYTTI